MNEINTALDNIIISLTQWSSIHPMFQLMEKARHIFSTINNNNFRQSIETKTGERGKGNSHQRDLNKKISHNLPSGFNSDEAWNAYIRKIIGTHSFLKDEELEKTVNFAGGFKQGCYLCRLNNHAYNDCAYLNAWKRFSQNILTQVSSQNRITKIS